MMLRAFLLMLGAFVSMQGAYGNEEDHHLGDWLGSWQGNNQSGHFDLALQRAPDGQVSGNIVVSTDNEPTSEYDVDLRNVSFEGDHFTAFFVTPGSSPDMIKLTGELGAQAGTGAWVAHRGTPAHIEESRSGTWQLQKHVG